MKKQIKKRLTISKITISNLNSEELDKVHGGTKSDTYNYDCDTRHGCYSDYPPPMCPSTLDCVSKACIPTS